MAIRRKLPPLNEFGVWARHLRKLHEVGEKRDPYRKGIDRLKAGLYEYFIALSEKGMIDDLAAYVESEHSVWKGPFPGDACWVARLIEYKPEFLLDRSARNRIVDDIQLAHRNKIRPPYFISFLKEVGSPDVRKAHLKSGTYFKWAEHYR